MYDSVRGHMTHCASIRKHTRLIVPLTTTPYDTSKGTDARSVVAGCQEAIVGACSHFGPLPPTAAVSCTVVQETGDPLEWRNIEGAVLTRNTSPLTHLFREGVKVLDCLPSGSFWTPLW